MDFEKPTRIKALQKDANTTRHTLLEGLCHMLSREDAAEMVLGAGRSSTTPRAARASAQL